jgi:hypothetical protein
MQTMWTKTGYLMGVALLVVAGEWGLQLPVALLAGGERQQEKLKESPGSGGLIARVKHLEEEHEDLRARLADAETKLAKYEKFLQIDPASKQVAVAGSLKVNGSVSATQDLSVKGITATGIDSRRLVIRDAKGGAALLLQENNSEAYILMYSPNGKLNRELWITTDGKWKRSSLIEP